MSLQVIARELDVLVEELRTLEARIAGSHPAHGPWLAASATAQVQALHVRLDALTVEVHGFQARAGSGGAPMLDVG